MLEDARLARKTGTLSLETWSAFPWTGVYISWAIKDWKPPLMLDIVHSFIHSFPHSKRTSIISKNMKEKRRMWHRSHPGSRVRCKLILYICCEPGSALGAGDMATDKQVMAPATWSSWQRGQ